MLAERLPGTDRAPRKELDTDFRVQYTITLETSNGFVGLVSTPFRLHLMYPKHIAEVLGSVPSYVVTRLGTELAMANAHPEARRHLDFPAARAQLQRYTDNELRQTLRRNGVAFKDSPFTEIEDDLIASTLDVQKAQPVKHVGATAVDRWDYTGSFKDDDKPLVRNEVGQIVAYQDLGERQFGRFYGNIEDSGGRVWVDVVGSGQLHYLPYIDADGRLARTSNGYNGSNMIETFPHSFWNIYAPEAPTTDPEAVGKYREGFIDLAAEVAMRIGIVKSISVSPHEWLRYTPESLPKMGYQDIRSVHKEYRWGPWKNKPDDVVMGQKDLRRIALIDEGRDGPTWKATISRKVPSDLAPQELSNLIKEELAVDLHSTYSNAFLNP